MQRVARRPAWSAIVLSLSLSLLGVAHAQPAAPPAPPPRVLSPEIAADGKVTFRLRAAEARAVALSSGGDLPQIPFGQTLPFTKGTDGVWSLTIGPVDPGAYRYAFVVDGVSVVDPAQSRVSPANDNVWSLFAVPGAKFMDTLDVPHGTVAEVRYYSKELGKWRRMHVYTPPGYGMAQKSYPVLYLLHGAFDSDASWSTVGREADILDNSIAEGRAAPMIVAMPAGHTGPFNLGGAAGLGIDEFVREFERDIRPYVEKHYTIRTGPKSTAIAGLSMGGAQTLEIAIKHLKDFGYVGVFSSGVLGGNGASAVDDWGARNAAQLDDKAARSSLALLWFSTGKDDFLLQTTKATVALFEKHGFKPTFKESTGGHTWINWREYLHEFAPQLFK
jgi:enterochelin esterase-like enzyme